jgi:hypothetical protein
MQAELGTPVRVKVVDASDATRDRIVSMGPYLRVRSARNVQSVRMLLQDDALSSD